jgi:hypothetical protein
VSTAPALAAKVIPVTAASPADREAMWNLYRRFYSGTHRDLFDRDLAAKDSLLLLRDEADAIQGFSTMAVGVTEFEGRTIRYVFSGDTIIDRDYWGTQALAFLLAALRGRTQARAARTTAVLVPHREGPPHFPLPAHLRARILAALGTGHSGLHRRADAQARRGTFR